MFQGAKIGSMKVLVSGSSGLIGSAVVTQLKKDGHSVSRLVRSKSGLPEEQVLWNPTARIIDSRGLEGFDAFIHLAGDPIAEGRWTQEKKAAIRDSRVKGTRLITEAVARLARPPKAFLCASAIGYYGDRGDELLTEESPPGTGFLPETGIQWEQACQPAADVGARVVNLRFGIVMSKEGGALKKMLPPFLFGMGGKLGGGKQWMSWISLPDAAAAVSHALTDASLRGPVNITAPNPATNADFTKALGKALRRPAVATVPAFAVRMMFGEMADAALLASTRVEPKRLKASGFRFKHPDLEPALRELLK